ncbi:hypothetical protein, partial [Apilactobacillus ozensis]|uniref:hypothetical protein n=1 Tax=Apilactobacillus ozensis TaxID=866801 RepID=UPI00138F2422
LKTKEENARKNYESVVARIAAQKAVAEKQSHADAYNAQHQANLAEAAEKQAHIADRNKMHEQRENDPVLTAKHALTEAKKAVKNNKDASALSDLKTKEENARKNYESVVAHSQSQNNNIASM